MPYESPSPDQLLREGFTLDVERCPDTPLERGDLLLYTDRRSGRVIVARAPILIAGDGARP